MPTRYSSSGFKKDVGDRSLELGKVVCGVVAKAWATHLEVIAM